MAASPDHAYATLLMTDNYLPGAMVLGHSLKDGGTSKQLIALITPETISASTIDELKKVYDQVIPIARISNASPGNLYLMGREDLASTFSKIALWTLTQFKRLVYIDADVVALRAPDELFDLKSSFAAAPDVGWPDIFNSGVMALTPNFQDYHALQSLATSGVSFDGADQGLLNIHFSRNLWERLSFTYNCTPSGNYQYAPAYRYFGSQISLVHFIGREKPWQVGRYASGFGGVYRELTARWWAVYDKYYRVPTYTPPSSQSPSNRSSSDELSSNQVPAENSTVQTHVRGESDFRLAGAPSPSPADSQSHQPPPPENTQTQSIPTVVLHHPPEEPPRSVEPERRFSAPRVEWDPARNPPPAESQPEAANFPETVYEMSKDIEFFKPPAAYPAPPSDMYYEVPKEKPRVHERPKVIFPWEVNQPTASRVFPDEPPLPPVPDPDHKPDPLPTLDTSGAEGSPGGTEGTSTKSDVVLPPSIAASGFDNQTFTSYSRVNAWDMIPGIQNYAEAWRNRRKGKHSPAASITSITQDKDRRPSLLLTDFPTEVERPSLPVTPAPIRAGEVFWGREQTSEDLPHAVGVPAPEAWDPGARLEELQRRQSEVFLAGPVSSRVLPSREAITSAIEAAIIEDTEGQEVILEDQAMNSKVLPLSDKVSFTNTIKVEEVYENQRTYAKVLPAPEEISSISSTTAEDSQSQQTDARVLSLKKTPASDSATTTEDIEAEEVSPRDSAIGLEMPAAKDVQSERSVTNTQELDPLSLRNGSG